MQVMVIGALDLMPYMVSMSSVHGRVYRTLFRTTKPCWGMRATAADPCTTNLHGFQDR